MLKKFISNFSYKLEVKRLLAGERIRRIKEDDRGIAVLEIILIIVIILGLIIIFRKNLSEMIEEIFKKIQGNKDEILKPLS